MSRSLVALAFLFFLPCVAYAGAKLDVSFPKERSAKPLDGRVLLIIAANNETEPRLQVDSEHPRSAQIFGLDADGLKPGTPVTFDDSIFGYPRASLRDVPAGDYWIQAVLHRYETVRRSDGHTLKVPWDRGEGQQWNAAPGNLYSTPVKVRIDANAKATLSLDNEIPPIEPVPDTKYIRHIKIQSKLLSEFWGRPVFLGANVLLPEGWDTHPDAKYPLAVVHGHFSRTIDGFRPEPPDPDLKPVYSERFRLEGYNRIVQELSHQFYQDWTGPGFPRMLVVDIQHANPFYDDSYAVNSANVGPYGDAITYELIPEIERQFRGIGKGWSRFLYGGSTGGWEALAVQMFYPDEYNGCFAACPDPIDFRSFTVVNIYDNENAYWWEGPFQRVARPGKRDYLGQVYTTVEDMNHLELVLGTNSRSGGQWDIWQAVYSPVGPDGYPKPIWDKMTGNIDRSVAEYWREHYDLGHILKRDWATLGPKLKGKIHIYCGDMDNYYLNDAVYLVEDFLKTTTNPAYEGEVAYGDRAEHCWNGDPTRPNAYSRMRYHQMYAPRIVERILATAPAGSDVTSWRY